MGRRGPRPTPSAVLKKRGSWRAGANGDEPRPERGAPRCPVWLDPEAKKLWRSVVPMLDRAGVLTMVDGQTLARYCQTWARWRKADAFLQKNGETYTLRDEAGKVKMLLPFPQVSIAGGLAQQLTRLEQELGLTPSARTRIRVDMALPRDPGREELIQKHFGLRRA
ncbi:MAG: phage terminase small subunit P27 family [Phycisphaerales bacterium]|nr:phage terminase small subunit P27 family [Phycisphaerales bacterium]